MNFFKKIFYARALKAEALAQETERLCHLWLEELFSKDYRRAIQTVSPWTFEQKKRLAELLAPHLTHPEEEHRSKSALALSILGKPASVAVPSLLHALQKGGEDERINASSVLGRIAEPLEEIVPALLTALKDTNEEVRLNAAGSLARLGKNAKVAIPALLKALEDGSIQVRLNALSLLGKIGIEAQSALPFLTSVLEDPDEDVRIFAQMAVKRIQGELVAFPHSDKFF